MYVEPCHEVIKSNGNTLNYKQFLEYSSLREGAGKRRRMNGEQ